MRHDTVPFQVSQVYNYPLLEVKPAVRGMVAQGIVTATETPCVGLRSFTVYIIDCDIPGRDWPARYWTVGF